MFAEWRARLRARMVEALTQHRERHGIKLSMYIENAPLRETKLWPKLEPDGVREERICRGSELRLGRALAAAGIPGADAVVTRAALSLAASDDDVAPRVDQEELRILGMVTRIDDLPFPRWYKRYLARRQAVLDTPQGQSAFGC